MKSLTNKALAFSFALSAGFTTNAAPLVSLGDNTDLFFNGSTSLKYNDNIYYRGTAVEEDSIFSVKPGVEIKVGKPGRTEGYAKVVYKHEFLMYYDHDDLDTDLSDLNATAGLDGSKLDLTSNMTYKQSATNLEVGVGDNLLDQLNESENFTFDVYGKYALSEKIKLGAGYGLTNKNYKRDTYADFDTSALSLDAYYALSPKLDVSVGYRYRSTDVPGTDAIRGFDYDDNAFMLGIHGELSPKLRGKFLLGYQSRDVDNDLNYGEQDGVFADGSLTYMSTDKLNFTIGAKRDYSIGSTTFVTTTKTAYNVAANYAYNPLWSFKAALSFSNTEYDNRTGLTSREDDLTNLSIDARYRPNEYIDIVARYTYMDNDSNRAAASYDANVLSVTASLRY